VKEIFEVTKKLIRHLPSLNRYKYNFNSRIKKYFDLRTPKDNSILAKAYKKYDKPTLAMSANFGTVL